MSNPNTPEPLDLLPCPVPECGGEANEYYHRTATGSPYLYGLQCPKCNLRIESSVPSNAKRVWGAGRDQAPRPAPGSPSPDRKGREFFVWIHSPKTESAGKDILAVTWSSEAAVLFRQGFETECVLVREVAPAAPSQGAPATGRESFLAGVLNRILQLIEQWDTHDSPNAVEEMCEIRDLAEEALKPWGPATPAAVPAQGGGSPLKGIQDMIQNQRSLDPDESKALAMALQQTMDDAPTVPAQGEAAATTTRLKRLLAYFMQELQDSRKPMNDEDDLSVPDHECGFHTNPEAGYCAFCDSWGEAFEALNEGTTK